MTFENSNILEGKRDEGEKKRHFIYVHVKKVERNKMILTNFIFIVADNQNMKVPELCIKKKKKKVGEIEVQEGIEL